MGGKISIVLGPGRIVGPINDPDGTLFKEPALVFYGIGTAFVVTTTKVEVAGFDLVVSFVLEYPSGTDKVRVYRPKDPLSKEQIEQTIEHFIQYGWIYKLRS